MTPTDPQARLYEVVKSDNTVDEWRAEAINEDGEIYVVMFSGPHARERAEEYAAWKNGTKPAQARLVELQSCDDLLSQVENHTKELCDHCYERVRHVRDMLAALLRASSAPSESSEYAGVAQDKSTGAVSRRMDARTDAAQGTEPERLARPGVDVETVPPAPTPSEAGLRKKLEALAQQWISAAEQARLQKGQRTRTKAGHEVLANCGHTLLDALLRRHRAAEAPENGRQVTNGRISDSKE